MNRTTDWIELQKAWVNFPGITTFQKQELSKQIQKVKRISCQNMQQALMIAIIYNSTKQKVEKNLTLLLEMIKNYKNFGVNMQNQGIQRGQLEDKLKIIQKALQNKQFIDANEVIQFIQDNQCLVQLFKLYEWFTSTQAEPYQYLCKIFFSNLHIFLVMNNDKNNITSTYSYKNLIQINILSYNRQFYLVELNESSIKSPVHSLNSPQNINYPSITNPTISRVLNLIQDKKQQPLTNPTDPYFHQNYGNFDNQANRSGQNFQNNSSPVKNRDHPLYYNDQYSSPNKRVLNFCSLCQKIQQNSDDLFVNEACGHGMCRSCVMRQGYSNDEKINCLKRGCINKIKMIEMENFFSKIFISDMSQSIKTFTIECSYCQKQSKIDLDRKPEYYRCQFCNKNSCNLHEKTTNLEKCFCKCFKCLSDAKISQKMKICEKCKISKCIRCNSIYQEIKTCGCGCQLCNRLLQVIDGKFETCQCQKDLCSFCLLNLDSNTIIKPSIQCSHNSCHPCFIKQQNTNQRIKCILCSQQ